MGISHAYTQTVADGTATSVVRPSDWNSGHILAQQFGGNTAGVSSISGTNLVWAGGNNITLSANGSTVSIIGQSGGGGTNYVFNNANGVTFGTNGSIVTASVQTNYAATDITTNAVATSASSLFFQTSASSNLVAASNSSLFQQTSATSAITSNAFPSANTTKFAGTGFTSTTTAGTAVTAALGTNGLTMAVPQFLTTAALSGDTSKYAGTGYTSAAQAGSTVGVTHNTSGLSMAWPPFITTYVAQSTQTQPAGIIAGVGTTFAGTNATATIGLNSNGLALSLSAAAGGGGGGSVNISAGTTSNNLTNFVLANSNNVSFGLNGSTITATATAPIIYSASNGSSSSSILNFTNNNGITFVNSLAVGGIYIAHELQYTSLTSGITSNAFPTANTTKLAGTGTTFNGSNISATINLNSVGLNLALSGATVAPSPVNVSAGTTSNNLQTIQFDNANGISFGLSGATITASAASAVATAYTLNSYSANSSSSNFTSITSNLWLPVVRIEPPTYLDAQKIIAAVSQQVNNGGVSVTGYISSSTTLAATVGSTMSMTAWLYSRGATNVTAALYNSIVSFSSFAATSAADWNYAMSCSTNAGSASVSYSTTANAYVPYSIDASGGLTTTQYSINGTQSSSSQSTNGNSFTFSRNTTIPADLWGGLKYFFIPGTSGALPPGEYWVALSGSSTTNYTTAGGSRVSSVSNINSGINYFVGQTFGPLTTSTTGLPILMTIAQYGGGMYRSDLTTNMSTIALSNISRNMVAALTLGGV